MTVLKKVWPFSFRRRSVNHAASNREMAICGIKPMIHRISVLPKYLGRSVANRVM